MFFYFCQEVAEWISDISSFGPTSVTWTSDTGNVSGNDSDDGDVYPKNRHSVSIDMKNKNERVLWSYFASHNPAPQVRRTVCK